MINSDRSFVIHLTKKSLFKSRNVFFDGNFSGKNSRGVLSKPPSHSSNVDGEYCVCSINPDGDLEVEIDANGFYRLFYSFNRDGLFLSNCFESLSHSLGESGDDLDVEAFYPYLFSQNGFFSCPFSMRTSSRKIKVLRRGEVLVYDGEGISITSGRGKSLGLTEGFDDYERLLDRSIEEIQKEISFVSSGFSGENTVLHLSGGKDSRAVLALVSSVLNSDRYNVNTLFPAPSLKPDVYRTLKHDYFLACTMADALEVRVLKKFKRSFSYGALSSYIHAVGKYKSNNNFNGFDAKYSLGTYFDPVLEMRGAAGEALRASPNRFNRIKRKASSFEFTQNSKNVSDFYSLAFDQMVKVKGAGYERARDFFVDYFCSLDGVSVREKLESRFVVERNSRHYGHYRLKAGSNISTLQPLTSTALYQASKLLTPEERASNKVIHDIIKKCQPSLLEFPFTGDSALDSVSLEERGVTIPSYIVGADVVVGGKADRKMQGSHIDFGIHMLDSIYASGVGLPDSGYAYLKKKLLLKSSVSGGVFLKLKSVYDSICPGNLGVDYDFLRI